MNTVRLFMTAVFGITTIAAVLILFVAWEEINPARFIMLVILSGAASLSCVTTFMAYLENRN